NGSGFYSLASPRGAFTLTASKTGYTSASAPATIQSNVTLTIDLAFARFGQIEGDVVAGGTPVVATIGFYVGSVRVAFATANAAGHYVINAPPGAGFLRGDPIADYDAPDDLGVTVPAGGTTTVA